jgi:hypothetical protein
MLNKCVNILSRHHIERTVPLLICFLICRPNHKYYGSSYNRFFQFCLFNLAHVRIYLTYYKLIRHFVIRVYIFLILDCCGVTRYYLGNNSGVFFLQILDYRGIARYYRRYNPTSSIKRR